jgi:hypothetical protein
MPKILQRVEYEGKKYTWNELSDMSGIPQGIIRERVKNGWSVDKAISTKVRKLKRTTRKRANCGAVSYQDCFTCKYPDCIMPRISFDDDPIKKGGELFEQRRTL